LGKGDLVEDRFYEIYKMLLDGYQTAQTLSAKLGLSSKTIRNYIKELDELLSGHGAFVKSKAGTGFKVITEDQALLDTFIRETGMDFFNNSSIPNTSKKRIRYLLQYLLGTDEYVRMDDLCNTLYISKKTLRNELKEVEALLNEHHLKLERRPKYGIRAVGTEFNTRMCLASYTMREQARNEHHILLFAHELEDLKTIITDCLREQNFDMSNTALQNLTLHLYIAMERIKNGHTIEMDKSLKETISSYRELSIANVVAVKISESSGMAFPEEEVYYLAIHLAGKKMMNDDRETLDNIVINQEIMDIITDMFEVVGNAFQLDFKNDLELRMSLGRHIVPLITRIQCNINLRNPLLKDIKKNFPLAYTIAATACTVFTERYGKTLKEDEIGYIALAFALSLEHMHGDETKLNILLVCASGMGSAQLLKYRYQKVFEGYIGMITTCDVNQVQTMDFAHIDYIFTTVPIRVKVPVPILEVSYFIEDADIDGIKLILSKGSHYDMELHYKRELFFPSLALSTKHEVLLFLSQQVMNYTGLGMEFYESVLQREKLAQTEFGNMVAMPHPYLAMGHETIVSVAVLQEPILWGQGKIQVVFLISFGRQKKKDLENFYQITSQYLLSKNYIHDLIQNRDFDQMIARFEEIEKDAAN